MGGRCDVCGFGGFGLAATGPRGRRTATPHAHHRSAARRQNAGGGQWFFDAGDLARRFLRAVHVWWIFGTPVGFSRTEIAPRAAARRWDILVSRLPEGCPPGGS